MNSIVNQTFKNYEIILVDDGSTDDSGKICDRYAEKYDFIRVIHKQNGGICNTRKAGYMNSCGEYIAYVDSDDSIDRNMFEVMMNKAQTYNADIVICNILLDMGYKKIIRSNIVKKGFYNKDKLKKEFYPKMLFGGINGTPGIIPSLCNKIIKRSVLKNALMDADDSISFGEDTLCSFPCLLDAQSVYICNNAFYFYRMVETSVTHVYDEKLIEKFILLVELLDKAFKKRNFDAKNQLSCYTARFSVDIIRNELLYNKKYTLNKRIRIVLEYLDNPIIFLSFKNIHIREFHRTNYIKIYLIKNKNIRLLYLFFYFKNILLNFRRH